MRKPFLALLLCLFATVSASAVESKSGTVTIPVDEYILLKDASKGPNLTTIESVTFDGTLGKSLSVTISGSASGAPSAVAFLQRGELFGLKDCTGSNAMLSGSDSHLQIVPLRSERFRLTCQVFVRNWAQLEFNVENALFVGAKVAGSEALINGGSGVQTVSLVRPAMPSEDSKAPLAIVARYHVTVLPEEARFQYDFQISNPNRSIRKITIPAKNGEIFNQVRTSIQHHETKDSLTLDLQPGENNVQVTGRFSASQFDMPIDAQSFLLVENSPALQLTIQATGSRRVSPSDAGMTPKYSGARAYMLSPNDKISWTSRKLEVFSALGYSVTSANYLYYVPRSGSPIVEAQFDINNQGTPEIAMKVPGQVTYLEVGGQAQVLSRDPEGRLLLQLPTGQQSVMVQYVSQHSHGSLIAIPREELVRPDSVLSNVEMSLSLDPRWSLVAGRSLFEINSDLSLSCIVWGIVFGLLAFFFFRHANVAQKWSQLGGLAIGILTAFGAGVTPWLVVVAVLALIIRYRYDLLRRWPSSKWGQLGVVVGLGLAVSISAGILMNLQTGSRRVMRFASEQAYNKMENVSAKFGKAQMNEAPQIGAMAARENEGAEPFADMDAAPGNAGDYQGVPARLNIPSGRIVRFSQGVIDANSPAKIGAFLVNRAVGAFLVLIALAGLAWIFYRERKHLMGYLRWS